MKYIMYPHGGSGNHGCEAIVRSTALIIQSVDSESDIILYSMNPQQDIDFKLNDICYIRAQNSPIKRVSLRYIKAVFLRYILNNKEGYDIISFKDIFNNSKINTIALSIGGDNYCYGQPEHIYFMNKYIRKGGAKSVLWGCSVEPSDVNDKMIEDLKGYDLITARETISYECLKKINLNTKLYPDPAFILKEQQIPLPDGFIEGETIGINLSPMIIGYENQKGVTIENYITLIDHIINTTSMNIALIPHVVWEYNNDLIPLTELYNKFKHSERVVLIGSKYNSMQLKYIISKLRAFIAARTHASIAAYSTCVPTLVIGYSVKARGIARDIFESEEGYVIPVQALKYKTDLIKAFDNLMKNENNIRQHLKEFIPRYTQRIFDEGIELKKLI